MPTEIERLDAIDARLAAIEKEQASVKAVMDSPIIQRAWAWLQSPVVTHAISIGATALVTWLLTLGTVKPEKVEVPVPGPKETVVVPGPERVIVREVPPKDQPASIRKAGEK